MSVHKNSRLTVNSQRRDGILQHPYVSSVPACKRKKHTAHSRQLVRACVIQRCGANLRGSVKNAESVSKAIGQAYNTVVMRRSVAG